MNSYVVDAALVAKWAFPEAATRAALDLLDASFAGKSLLLAPDLLVAELGTLVRRKVRGGELPAADAAETFALLLGMAPVLVPTAELAAPALELALRHDRPYAEALHLALALREGCVYLTTDDRLFRALAPAFPCVRHLADLTPP